MVMEGGGGPFSDSTRFAYYLFILLDCEVVGMKQLTSHNFQRIRKVKVTRN